MANHYYQAIFMPYIQLVDSHLHTEIDLVMLMFDRDRLILAIISTSAKLDVSPQPITTGQNQFVVGCIVVFPVYLFDSMDQ